MKWLVVCLFEFAYPFILFYFVIFLTEETHLADPSGAPITGKDVPGLATPQLWGVSRELHFIFSWRIDPKLL